jgi:hypothetical protein
MQIILNSETSVKEQSELTINNTLKVFNITTDVEEIDGIKGGNITGEDMRPYETVEYGGTSTKEIKMIPNENYEIISINVNGEEYQFEKDSDGSFTMPQFENVTEDKHVVVTYSLKDNKITINKVDSITNESIPNVTFTLDQIEERTVPLNDDIIGNLTDNGQLYDTITDEEVTGRLGSLTNNGTYYFVEQNGKYYPTNSKTYQIANGGTAGKPSTTANSYIPIDLTDLTGRYGVVINAQVSSENSYDYGYATITESTSAPAYTTTAGRFIYICGTQSAKNYSTILNGGKMYYIHLGYRKDGSGDTGSDQIIINSVKLYNVNSVQYNFIINDEKYVSSNQGKNSTVSNSYIPINLTNYVGKYNLTVNAEISSQSEYDSGYATVTENTTIPEYNNTVGRFIYLSGEQQARDYTTVLQGGKIYYLHLGYYKNADTNSGDDKFSINSVNITLNDSELYHTQVTTNRDGKGITQIPFGKYLVTETNVPDEYLILEEPVEIEFRSYDGAQHEFTIENSKKASVIVHHYIKGTEEKLAEDEEKLGKVGENYTTMPKLDLEKYTLEKDEQDNYILPINASGQYSSDDIEVIYYYVEKKIPLFVHHFREL